MLFDFDACIKIAFEITRERRNKGKLRCAHVAFIFDRKKLISIGVNDLYKGHPRTRDYAYSLEKTGCCAEFKAVINAKETEDFSRMTMFVLRVDSNWKINYSKPCVGCLDLVKKHNFKDTYFTNNLGEVENL